MPGKSHWRRSLIGDSPWGRQELDTTERLHFHFMEESEEELKSLLMEVKVESEKVGLNFFWTFSELNIQKMKIMACGPITYGK